MNQFKGHSYIFQLFQIIGSEFAAKQHKDRAKALSACFQKMQGGFAEQLVIALDATVQLPFDIIDILF
ncbi:hypothetical protein D3C80_2020020 [compost metagenome]